MLLLYSVATFLFTCAVITTLIPLAVKFGLVDLPNQRKVHTGEVPLIGGIAIFLSSLIISSFVFEFNQLFNLYFISASLILFVGVLDDKYDLPVGLRLFAQVITASILIFGAGFYINTFGSIFYFGEFVLGPLGTIVTIIAVLAAINAFNMVDGVDGLAGMLSVVSFTSLAFMFHDINELWFSLAVLFVSSILAYLVFNLRWPISSVDKVFMGDAGSMLIGLSIVWMLVIGVNSEGNGQAFRPVAALYFIAVPLMDMMAIMQRRIKKGQSAFTPDRDHLHHIFLRIGFNRKQTLITITLFASLVAVVGIYCELQQVAEWKLFVAFVLLFLIYSFILKKLSHLKPI